MPAIPHVDLVLEGQALSTTAGTVVGTSANLVDGATYLVLASGYCCPDATGVDGISDLLVGGTVHARQRGSAVFAPSAALDVSGMGGVAGMGAAFTYTAGTSEAMEVQASSSSAGDGTWRIYALELTSIGTRYHQESTNEDAIATTPTSGGGWQTVGTAMVESPGAGDYLLIASCEAVPAGGVAAADEIGIRVTIGGTEISGSRVEMDVGPTPTTQISGYLFVRRVTLGAGSQTIAVEGNGSISNGNVGFRRVRLHLIPVSEFEDAEIEQNLDTDGESLTGTADVDISSGGLSIAPSSEADYLIFGRVPKQVSFWSQSYLLRDPAGTPVEIAGFGLGVDTASTAASGDLQSEFGLFLDAARSTATDYSIRISKLGGGGSNSYGDSCARSAQNIGITAIRLATPATGGSTLELGPATITGQSSLDGPLVLDLALSGEVIGQSSLDGALELTATLELGPASVVGQSSLDGALSMDLDLFGEAIGQSSLEGPLELFMPVELGPASVVGQSSLDGTLVLDLALSGSATGQSTLDGALSLALALSGSATGQSTLEGDLAIAGTIDLGVVSVIGQSTLEGDLTITGAVPFPRRARLVRSNRTARGNVVRKGPR